MLAEEFLSIGETADRYELIDRTVVMSPSPGFRHNRIHRYLLRELERCSESIDGLEIVFETDIKFDPHFVYRPDIAVFAPGAALDQTADRIDDVPDLIIEILSRGSRALDLITKRDDYERFGVGEYWAVDPDPVNARIWRRSGAQLLEQGVQSEIVECHSIPGVRVDLSRVRSAVGLA